MNGELVKELVVPNDVTEIKQYAFYNCSNLRDITIGNSVTIIGGRAFDGTAWFNKQPNGCVYIGKVFYKYKGTMPANTSVTIEEGTLWISGDSFYDCRNLTNVTIPNSVTGIGDRAFFGCNSLTSVTIGNSVTSIGDRAFFGCNSLTSVTIGNSVTSIGCGAFEGCSSLTSVTIGNSVTSIGDDAFNDCGNLYEVKCYAMEPPELGVSVFLGIADEAVLMVHQHVLNLYSSHSGWSVFQNILPLDSFVQLVVNMPNGSIDDYENMLLELTDKETGIVRKYTISDKLGYTFNVARNRKYRLVLRNAVGYVLKEIDDIEIGNNNQTFNLSALPQLYTVGVDVLLPDGTDITEKVIVAWKDTANNYLSGKPRLEKMAEGSVVRLSVAVHEEYATDYHAPTDTLYKVTAGENKLNVVLKPLKEVVVSGVVKESGTGLPIRHAKIVVAQELNGKHTKIWNTQTAEDGKFSIAIYDAAGELSIKANGFIVKNIECNNWQNTDFSNVQLEPLSGTIITTNFMYTPSVVAGESAETENHYNDYANIVYTIYNTTQTKEVNDFIVQYPDIFLQENASPGDVLEIIATSRNGAFAPVATQVTVSEQNRGEVYIDIVEPGRLRAVFKKNSNRGVVGVLYTSGGDRVAAANYNNGVLEIDGLPDGKYFLLTMGESPLFNNVYNLSYLEASDIEENEDYIINEVIIEKGVIVVVEIEEIPLLDDTKLYYTGNNTGFSVNKSSLSVGNYLTFSGSVDFKNEYVGRIENVRMVIDLPESAEFVEYSAIIGQDFVNCSMVNNRLTVPVDDHLAERVRFCIIPKTSGNYAVDAFVQFCIGDREIIQPIGNATYSVRELDINVPSVIMESSFSVTGTATAYSEVLVYADDMLVGKTISMGNGTWNAACNLGDVYNLSVYSIYARILTPQGYNLESEIKECTYDKYGIMVDKVTLHYNGNKIVFDFNKPSVKENSYTYTGNPSFTFTIDFNDNDTLKVYDVELQVKSMAGKWYSFPAEYDSDRQQWVVNIDTNSLGGSYPVNVGVYYDCKKEIVADRDHLDNNIKDLCYSLDLLNKEYETLKSKLVLDIEDSLYKEVFNEVDRILSKDSIDYDALLETLNSYIAQEGNYADSDSTLVEFETLVKEFEEMKSGLDENGKDALLAEFYIMGGDDINTDEDISETIQGENGQITYKKTLLFSIDENELLNQGYTVLPATDSTKIYSLYTGNGVEYIDSKTRIKYSIDTESFVQTRSVSKVSKLSQVKCYEAVVKILAELKNLQYPSSGLLEDIMQYELSLAKLSSELMDAIECLYSSLRRKCEDGINKAYLKAYNEISGKIDKRKAIIDNRINDIKKLSEELKDLSNTRLRKIEELEYVNLLLRDGKYTGEALEDLNNQKVILEAEIKGYQEAIANWDIKIKKATETIKTISKQISNLENYKTNLKEFNDLALKKLSKIPLSVVNGIPQSKLLLTFGKIAGPLGIFIDIICLYNDTRRFNNEVKEWAYLLNAMVEKLPCENDAADAYKLTDDICDDFVIMQRYWKSALLSAGLAIVVDCIPLNLATWIISGALTGYSEMTKWLKGEEFIGKRGEHWSSMSKLKCHKKEEDPPRRRRKEEKFGVPDLRPIIDPAGYVYEGVPSNRLEGVTATCYYKDFVEDMYGDKHENIVMWDAVSYGQQNPLLTDKYGMYSWDVPQGLWQVKFEKEGYETVYSEWLPVPPPQLEVNMAMIQYRQPEVKNAIAYEGAVEVEFDKYMKIDSLMVDKFVVIQNGKPVSGELKLLNIENSHNENEESYVSIVRFNATELFTEKEVMLVVKKELFSYAGLSMAEDFSQTLKVEKEIKMMEVKDSVTIPYNGEKNITVSLEPIEAAVGKTVCAEVDAEALASLVEEKVTVNEQGKAKFTLKGELPGVTYVNFSVDGRRDTAQATVTVLNKEFMMLEMPEASVASGSSIYKGTEIVLSAKGDGVRIWYTIDGTCPCDENSTRQVYSKPIRVEEDVTLKAMAENEEEEETSETATFVYKILKSENGIQLNEGWNWVSFNMESEALQSVNATLEDGDWSNGDEIKTACHFDSYSVNERRWIGTLSQHVGGVNNREMYKLYSSKKQDVELSGIAVNPGSTSIVVGPNWNYISYLPLADLNVEEALSGYRAQVGDILKSQDEFAVYTDAKNWEGELKMMKAGRGYMLKRDSNAPATEFYYPSTISADHSLKINKWQNRNYSGNMNIIGVVDGCEVNNGDTLVAVVQGEQRGVYALGSGSKVYMTVQGDYDADVNFLLKRGNRVISRSSNSITFKCDTVIGTMSFPARINFESIAELERISVSPHIVEDELLVVVNDELMEKIEVTIYNADGMIVRERKKRTILNGYYSERFSMSDMPIGVYFVRILVNGNPSTVRVIKK